jgi:hypothetical protein
VVEDNEPVALRTLKERLVLGVVLLHANEFVSRERLIDDLWGEAPPPTARKAVNVLSLEGPEGARRRRRRSDHDRCGRLSAERRPRKAPREPHASPRCERAAASR